VPSRSITGATTAFVALISGINQRDTFSDESPGIEVTVSGDDEPGIPGACLGGLVGDVALCSAGWLADRARHRKFLLLVRPHGCDARVSGPRSNARDVVLQCWTGGSER
jgi:hypothetical protein